MNRDWSLRLIGAGIWVFAGLTWGSIGHHLFGLPDVGAGIAIVAAAVVLAWPRPGRDRDARTLAGIGSTTQGSALTKADLPAGR